MNIVYVSEQNFVGKIPDDVESFRSDLAWIKMIDAFHIPYSKASPNKDNEYFSVLEAADLILFVPSKKNPQTIDFLFGYHELGKKVGLIQEGSKTYWLNWPTVYQINYLAAMKIVDVILCHNETDKDYFMSFTNKPVIVFKTVLDVLHWKKERVCPRDKEESVFVAGNMTEWYGGIHSYSVAAQKEITKIGIPSMGRKTVDEEDMFARLDKRVHYYPYMDWATFMRTLKDYKYAVHMMRVSAAGSFNLNCAALGIPCIGNIDDDTQRLLFPKLSVHPDEISKAAGLMKKLVEDQDFYDEVVTYALEKVKDFDLYGNKEYYHKLLEDVINGSE